MANAEDFAAAFAGAEGGEMPPDALAKLDAEIHRLIELERYIADAEANISAAKAAANRIKQRTLPDIMSELRVDDITREGFKIKLTSFVSGSMPNADDKPEAHERAVSYLKTLPGGEELLKTRVALEFGKGESNLATSIVQGLVDEYGIEPAVKFGVHTQTLHAFVRERMENSEPVDTDALGIYCGTAVKVTAVKERKAKK